MSREKQIEEMAKVLCKHYGTDKCGDCWNYNMCPANRNAEKFYNAGYRKQSENTVELPCKIGQKVYTNFAMQGWYFRSNDKPYSAEIVFIGINNSEEMGGGFFNIAYENRGYMMQFKFSEIGKTVFLTKEEAEAKMKGGE